MKLQIDGNTKEICGLNFSALKIFVCAHKQLSLLGVRWQQGEFSASVLHLDRASLNFGVIDWWGVIFQCSLLIVAVGLPYNYIGALRRQQRAGTYIACKRIRRLFLCPTHLIVRWRKKSPRAFWFGCVDSRSHAEMLDSSALCDCVCVRFIMHQAMSSHSIGRMSIYRVSDAVDVHDNGIICGLAWYLLALPWSPLQTTSNWARSIDVRTADCMHCWWVVVNGKVHWYL